MCRNRLKGIRCVVSLRKSLQQYRRCIFHASGGFYIQNSLSMEKDARNYKVVERIGEGAHGVVLRAYDRTNQQFVALKRMIISNKGDDKIPISVLREIKALQHTNCKNVIKLLGVLTSGPTLVLVLELMAGGLSHVLNDVKHVLSVPHSKCFMKMFLNGLNHLHHNHIIHRDLKPANLLIGFDGVLRIADLGQARLARGRPFSHQVGSRWYRAPELLFGSRRYGFPVDIWSAGCIMAELINRSPLFPGETDIEQLAMVIRSLGSPSEENWPGIKSLPDYDKISFPHTTGRSWRMLVPDSPPGGIEFIKSFIQYNPALRITADQALNHKFLLMEPLPLTEVPLPSDSFREKIDIPKINLEQPIQDHLSNLHKMFP